MRRGRGPHGRDHHHSSTPNRRREQLLAGWKRGATTTARGRRPHLQHPPNHRREQLLAGWNRGATPTARGRRPQHPQPPPPATARGVETGCNGDGTKATTTTSTLRTHHHLCEQLLAGWGRRGAPTVQTHRPALYMRGELELHPHLQPLRARRQAIAHRCAAGASHWVVVGM
jgi:hypothetical protein